MKKLAIAAALITAGWALLAWNDTPAQDAADNGAKHATCKAGDR